LTTAAPAPTRAPSRAWTERSSGRTPPIELDRLRELGSRLVLAPLTALLAATRAVQGALAATRRPGAGPRGSARPSRPSPTSSGLPEMRRIEERFTPVAPQP
jgi:2,3-dimethylmalate lyase